MTETSHLPWLDAVFAPVRSQTAFEETLQRLSTAIKLGLLAPGARLPAERELCARLEISRSTLRQALTALARSGHLHAIRGRGGGTFVAEQPPTAPAPSRSVVRGWREVCDARLAIELGVAALATARAEPGDLHPLDALVASMDALTGDFAAYRQADVRFHIGLAEAAHSPRLVAMETQVQGAMSDLVCLVPHPPEILAHANAQHVRLLASLRARDREATVRAMADHLHATELVLAGLLPATA